MDYMLLFSQSLFWVIVTGSLCILALLMGFMLLKAWDMFFGMLLDMLDMKKAFIQFIIQKYTQGTVIAKVDPEHLFKPEE